MKHDSKKLAWHEFAYATNRAGPTTNPEGTVVIDTTAHHARERAGRGVAYNSSLTDRLVRALEHFEERNESNVSHAVKRQLGLLPHEYERLKLFAKRMSVGVRNSRVLMEFMNHVRDGAVSEKVSRNRRRVIERALSKLLLEHRWRQASVGPSSTIEISMRLKRGTFDQTPPFVTSFLLYKTYVDLLIQRFRDVGIVMQFNTDTDGESETIVTLHNYNDIWPSIAKQLDDVCDWSFVGWNNYDD